MTDRKYRTFSLTEKASEMLDELDSYYKEKGMGMNRSMILSKLVVAYHDKIFNGRKKDGGNKVHEKTG